MYELFEDLLQQLLVAKPDKPLDFLQEQLEKKQSKCYTCHAYCDCNRNNMIFMRSEESICDGTARNFQDRVHQIDLGGNGLASDSGWLLDEGGGE